jgi:hypothetical protein
MHTIRNKQARGQGNLIALICININLGGAQVALDLHGRVRVLEEVAVAQVIGSNTSHTISQKRLHYPTSTSGVKSVQVNECSNEESILVFWEQFANCEAGSRSSTS